MTTPSTQYTSIVTTSGWVIFSGTIALIVAFANLMYGIVLLVNDDWIALTTQGLIRFDTTTAGVLFIVFAGVQTLVAFGIFNGDLWARIIGIIGASFGILSQMAFLSIYPAWSWLVIVIDGLIIYGLTVHGDEVASF
ncbi:MAG: hypothetical protein GY724_29585 [Actinomycetia bacterium]|nr:hypothetical protein [Actinomycetes bacterium]MCP5034766.1 hypothetical protein [Actinomycetes bacterium]